MPQYGLWTSKQPAALAAAALFLSNKLLRKPKAWPTVLADLTGLTEAALKPIAKELCNVLQQAAVEPQPSQPVGSAGGTRATMKAVKNKFSQSKYHCVAKMVL